MNSLYYNNAILYVPYNITYRIQDEEEGIELLCFQYGTMDMKAVFGIR